MWICFGGALGTGARHAVGLWMQRALGGAFPWGTLTVNVAGSFLLGAIAEVASSGERMSPTLRLALTTGVMGGFTTYSTFNHETLRHFQSGAIGTA
ncbi:MAG: CrcB family protein, partial [Myxococcota bacterium]